MADSDPHADSKALMIDDADSDPYVPYDPNRRHRRSWPAALLVPSLCVALAVSLLFNLASFFHGPRSCSSDSISASLDYVPLLDQLQVKTVQVTKDAWMSPLYGGKPTHEGDRAWEKVQAVRVIAVPNDEAASLNITGGLITNDGQTAALLGLMHNLHCLRVTRQALYPSYYYPNMTSSEHDSLLVHVGHCLEAIRHSVLCVPDLTPRAVVWEDKERTNIAINPAGTKQCVDYDSLQAWEKKRSYSLTDLWEANPAEDE